MRTTKGTQNELKSSISGIYRLKTEERRRTNEERRRTVENLRETTHENVTEASRLGFSSRKQFFSQILSESQIPGGLNIFFLPSRSNRLLEEHRGRPKWAWLLFEPPFLLNTPLPFFGDSFSLKLWKLTNFVTTLVFFL